MLADALPHGESSVLERIACECTVYSKTLDARFREHDEQEVIPAHAGIQEPYRQSQAALVYRTVESVTLFHMYRRRSDKKDAVHPLPLSWHPTEWCKKMGAQARPGPCRSRVGHAVHVMTRLGQV